MDNQHLEIRRVVPEDYQELHAIHSQPRAVWGTLQMPFPSIELWRNRLTAQSDERFGLVACVDGTVVGDIVLSVDSNSPRRRHVGELGGMAVHEDCRGHGVGSALIRAATDLADRWLNLSRLELIVYTDNLPAIRIYEKAGFEVEGTLRDFAFRDGEYTDAYLMARLRSSSLSKHTQAIPPSKPPYPATNLLNPEKIAAHHGG